MGFSTLAPCSRAAIKLVLLMIASLRRVWFDLKQFRDGIDLVAHFGDIRQADRTHRLLSDDRIAWSRR